MNKHTPGLLGEPKRYWEPIGKDYGQYLWELGHIDDDDNQASIVVSGYNAEANARLIAKSPEMYAIVEQFRNLFIGVHSFDWELFGNCEDLSSEADALLREIDKGGAE